MPIIKKETLDQLKAQGFVFNFYDEYMNDAPMETAHEISLSQMDECIIGKCIKLPKKMEVTLDWLMNKVYAESKFTSLAKACAKLVTGRGITIYPASYGIGFCNIFGKDQEKANELDTLLKEKGIEFKNEYSEAGWVYRFVISKSASNLKKLENI